LDTIRLEAEGNGHHAYCAWNRSLVEHNGSAKSVKRGQIRISAGQLSGHPVWDPCDPFRFLRDFTSIINSRRAAEEENTNSIVFEGTLQNSADPSCRKFEGSFLRVPRSRVLRPRHLAGRQKS
jgi:hypothetical protein